MYHDAGFFGIALHLSAVVVEGPDTSLLWWLHDHEVGGEVTVTGRATPPTVAADSRLK